MEKVIKRIAMLFMVCGLAVSISMGAYIPKSYEENYQKLKAEMEKAEQNEWNTDGSQLTCSFSEDGRIEGKIRGNNTLYMQEWCELKNVLAFFDEIRAMEVKVNKGEREFYVAINKVKEMPRFKEDYGIGITKMSINESRFTNDYAFWKRVFEKWEKVKIEVGAGLLW